MAREIFTLGKDLGSNEEETVSFILLVRKCNNKHEEVKHKHEEVKFGFRVSNLCKNGEAQL